MDSEDLWLDGQRAIIKKWGNNLYDQSHRVAGGGDRRGRRIPSARWPDTVGIATSAYLLWGVASNNNAVIKDGIKDYNWLLRRMRSDGSMNGFVRGKWENVLSGDKSNIGLGSSFSLRLHNDVIGYMVIAAHAAKVAGIDLYEKKSEGANLHDAIDWLLAATRNPKSVKNGPKTTQSTYYKFKSGGFAGTMAWVEVYSSDFPQSNILETIKSFRLAKNVDFKFAPTNLGRTTCMFRPPNKL